MKQRIAALACGGAAGLAFPEANAWWLMPFALAGAIAIAATADSALRAATRAWLAGIGYFVVSAHWLIPKTGPGLLIIAALLGLTWFPWGIAAHFALRTPRSPARLAVAMVVIPAAFVVGEYVRSWEYLGGPWALAGSSLWDTRAIVGLAAIGGVWLLTFAVVAVAVAIAGTILPGGSSVVRIGSTLAAFASVVCAVLMAEMAPGMEHAGSLSIAGVQPGPDLGADERLDRAIAATEELGPSELVVWGESSVGFDLRVPEVLARIEAASAAASAPVLANFDARSGSGGIFKSSILIDSSGAAGRYDKVRLVPFGEYIPLRPLLGWVGGVSEAADEDRRRGEGPVLIDVGDVAIGPLVCFESTFPDMSRRLADMGADVIIVQSATSSFQDSWAPEQHASLSAIRAVESGRTVVHATLTGVSAAFDAEGRELLRVPTDRRGTYHIEAPISGAVTLYVRFGDWVPAACLGGLLIWAAIRPWREAASKDGVPPP